MRRIARNASLRSDPSSRGDEHGGQGRHHDLADQARQRDQDDRHPQAGEDRGPAAPGAGRDAEGRLPHRTADRLAAEHAGEQVADALRHEVAVRLGASAVGVGCGLRHTGPLDQDQRGHRQGPRHQAHREVGELRQVRRGQALRDRTDVTDQLDGGGAHDRDDHAGDDQGDQRGVRRQPGAAEPDEGHQGSQAAGRGGRIDQAGMGHEVPELGQGERSRYVGPDQVGDLAEDDVERDTGQEADHHRVGHEPDVPAEPQARRPRPSRRRPAPSAGRARAGGRQPTGPRSRTRRRAPPRSSW